MRIILYQPQIPQNTGNIVRSCSVTGTGLILVHPLGFSTDDRWLKRAGLDYWEGVDMEMIGNLESYLEACNGNFTLLSSKGTKLYTDVEYTPDHLLIFGSETMGLPAPILEKWSDKTARIPMVNEARCLNLATSAGIVLYEALRQTNQFGKVLH